MVSVTPFFDPVTATFSYVVVDDATKSCAIIDPVLDYDPETGQSSTCSADELIALVKTSGLTVDWFLETHIHADHLTAAPYLQEKLGGKRGIGSNINKVLEYWVPHFKQNDTPLDGSQFDQLFKDGDGFSIGNTEVKVMHTPGHTPVCVCYIVDENVFVGDVIFQPDVGTARTDFPGGSADLLFSSIQKLYQLPDHYKIYVGHDYPTPGRQELAVTTIGEEKAKNLLLTGSTAREAFVELRNGRDEGKAPPRLMLPSLERNIRGGQV